MEEFDSSFLKEFKIHMLKKLLLNTSAVALLYVVQHGWKNFAFRSQQQRGGYDGKPRDDWKEISLLFFFFVEFLHEFR